MTKKQNYYDQTIRFLEFEATRLERVAQYRENKNDDEKYLLLADHIRSFARSLEKEEWMNKKD